MRHPTFWPRATQSPTCISFDFSNQKTRTLPRGKEFLSLDSSLGVRAGVGMGKDRRKEKEDVDEALGKQKDKFGKKGDGKATTAVPEKPFSHQECRHILVQKQGEALRIVEEIHDGKISFNEARTRTLSPLAAPNLMGSNTTTGRLLSSTQRTRLERMDC